MQAGLLPAGKANQIAAAPGKPFVIQDKLIPL
jgi:hypothetical protein